MNSPGPICHGRRSVDCSKRIKYEIGLTVLKNWIGMRFWSIFQLFRLKTAFAEKVERVEGEKKDHADPTQPLRSIKVGNYSCKIGKWHAR